MQDSSSAPEPSLALRVPGSTSNLGPGFDLLGLALSLHLEVRATPVPDATEHEMVRTGPFASEVDDADDLLLAAYERVLSELGVRAGALRLDVVCGIPVGRGFGSSGAAVAAGLLLGRARAAGADAEVPDLEHLLAWGIDIEGHPDNVTASLFGGCTLCHPDADGRPAHVSNPIDPGIGFAVAWPPDPLSTARARAVLPATVAFRDAVENPRRLALLLEGLRTGDARLLAIGGEDRLHVAYRLPLVPGAGEALFAARRAGAWLATISGAGSGMVALGPRARAASIAAAMQAAFEHVTGGGQGCVVEPVLGTPAVRAVP